MVLGFNGKCEAGWLAFWYYVLFISLAIRDIRFSNRLESKNKDHKESLPKKKPYIQHSLKAHTYISIIRDSENQR